MNDKALTAIAQAERAEPVTDDDLRAMLPRAFETADYLGDPAPYYTPKQMLDYGRAIAQKCGGMK